MESDPSKSRAWNEGYNARNNDKKDNESPYVEGFVEDDDWLDGWEDADDEIERERQ